MMLYGFIYCLPTFYYFYEICQRWQYITYLHSLAFYSNMICNILYCELASYLQNIVTWSLLPVATLHLSLMCHLLYSHKVSQTSPVGTTRYIANAIGYGKLGSIDSCFFCMLSVVEGYIDTVLAPSRRPIPSAYPVRNYAYAIVKLCLYSCETTFRQVRY